MIAGIMFVVLAAEMSPYATTAATFSIALTTLSIVATKQSRAPFWPYVDYFWVSATVISVFIAITGNTTSRNLKALANQGTSSETAFPTSSSSSMGPSTDHAAPIP